MASTYDVHFQILPPEEQVSTRVFGFGYVSAVGVRGPQKLINKWLKCFMTPQGSDPFSPGYGTGFADLIGSNVDSIEDAVDAIALFVQACSDQIKAFDRAALTPADERLQNASILEVGSASEDSVVIWIGITNAAGVQTPVMLPSVSVR